VQPRLSPRASLAADRRLLDERGDGALRVYTLAGDVVALGRWHLAPDAAPDAGVQVWRRHSGGRAMPWGDGFVALSLVLPHRSAIVAADPYALAPEQVMNRYVRGVLRACELSGVAAFYPGRDLITVDGRILGMASFEVDAGGALLFQVVLANERDASVLPALLDRADPGGIVRTTMLTPADTTSLARVLGRGLELDELAARLARGYAERLGVRFAARWQPIVDGEFDDAGWLAARRPRADLDRHAVVPGQIGVLDVHFAREEGRIRDVCLAGDFIASSPTVATLEDGLRGCAAEPGAIAAVVHGVLARPEHFVLGLGRPAQLADALAHELAA
jgi:lipoate-protein ligase A